MATTATMGATGVAPVLPVPRVAVVVQARVARVPLVVVARVALLGAVVRLALPVRLTSVAQRVLLAQRVPLAQRVLLAQRVPLAQRVLLALVPTRADSIRAAETRARQSGRARCLQSKRA